MRFGVKEMRTTLAGSNYLSQLDQFGIGRGLGIRVATPKIIRRQGCRIKGIR